MTAPSSINLRRHYASMSGKDTDEVIATIAELVVLYLKQRGELARLPPDQAEDASDE